MNAERDIQACLQEQWETLALPGPPPRRIASIMLKGNRKSVFLLFPPASRRPVLVLKYAEDPKEKYRLENEFGNLHNLSERIPDSAPALLTPARLVELGGGLGLLRKAAPGQPLAFRVRPPGRRKRQMDALFNRIYAWLVGLQEASRDRLPELQDGDLKRSVLHTHAILHGSPDAGVPAVVEAASIVENAYLDGTLPAVLEHGDYNPDNIYLHRNRLYVIDWEWAKAPGLPLVDLFEFALQYTRLGAILGRVRSQAISPRHLMHTFDPEGPLAPLLRRWTRRACSALNVPEAYIAPLAALFIARYVKGDPLREILDRALPLFAGPIEERP